VLRSLIPTPRLKKKCLELKKEKEESEKFVVWEDEYIFDDIYSEFKEEVEEYISKRVLGYRNADDNSELTEKFNFPLVLDDETCTRMLWLMLNEPLNKRLKDMNYYNDLLAFAKKHPFLESI
jgi:hypothetical protein